MTAIPSQHHDRSPYLRTSLPKTPLVIYGASSAVGFYALQLALRSNLHPLICVAGRASGRIRNYLDPSKGDVVVDYRDGEDAVVAGIENALKGKPRIQHIYDAISDGNSAKVVGQAFHRLGDVQTARFTFASMGNKEEVAKWVQQNMTFVGIVHMTPRGKDLANAYFRCIARGLQEGWFRGQRTEVVPGGLNGIQVALENLKAGKASGLKYVFRIGETG
ncbi:MAG: hypothetical protein M1821_000555 [Bathelium mastoideum]|nr:MAG: hypothetical protein M1821_000555 [Bathelium mastoideum]KAI9683020.1 MAG: hypothetical protein M1822_006213 [Bathelium mastoideum]